MPFNTRNQVKTKIDKVKILVIDDDANFLLGITRTLMHADYDVISTSDGLVSIQKAQTELPDLILLDVNMPKITGFQVKLILSRLPATQYIPVVFLSAMNEHAYILMGLNMADDYIPKPCEPDILVAKLKAILHRTKIGYAQAVRDRNNSDDLQKEATQ